MRVLCESHAGYQLGKTMKNAKADASLYLLTGLLQRLEKKDPELIQEMLSGVKADRAGVSTNITNYEYVSEIFSEAELVLERIQNLKEV